MWRVEDVANPRTIDPKRNSLLPRGLVGRLDKVLGCRALTLLMDAEGHPLLVLTASGDQHLTTGLPAVVDQYEQAQGQGSLAQIIIDREGMSGTLLNAPLPG